MKPDIPWMMSEEGSVYIYKQSLFLFPSYFFSSMDVLVILKNLENINN